MKMKILLLLRIHEDYILFSSKHLFIHIRITLQIYFIIKIFLIILTYNTYKQWILRLNLGHSQKEKEKKKKISIYKKSLVFIKISKYIIHLKLQDSSHYLIQLYLSHIRNCFFTFNDTKLHNVGKHIFFIVYQQ